MIHSYTGYKETCAPGILGVAVPAATRGRLRSHEVELSEYALIVVDDRCALAKLEKGTDAVGKPISQMVADILKAQAIHYHVLPHLNFDQFLQNSKKVDIHTPDSMDGVVDMLRTVLGEKYVGFLVPIKDAKRVIQLLRSPDNKALAGFVCLSHRAATMWGGTVSMSPDMAFLPAAIADDASRDVDTLMKFRREHAQREGGIA